MATKTRAFGILSLITATAFASTAGCEGDENEDCRKCCRCQWDNSDLVYEPDAASDCASCKEQCDDLAERDHAGNEFDITEEIECPD